jgi:metal-sulfur cluster biosynthetic enzyme
LTSELVRSVQGNLGELTEEETARKLSELNVIGDVREDSPGVITVRFTPLSAYSPTAVELGKKIRSAASSVSGVQKVTVECSGHMQDELINRLVNGEKKRM